VEPWRLERELMPLRWTCLAVGLILAAGIVAASPAQWQHEWPETDFSRSSVELFEIISGGPTEAG